MPVDNSQPALNSANQAIATLAASTPLARLQRAVLARGGLYPVPSVMASPPTITQGTAYAASAITGGVNYLVGSSALGLLNAANWTIAFSYNSVNYYYAPSSGTDGVNIGGIGVVHDGQRLEIWGRVNDQYQILVDGQLITSASAVLAPTGSGLSPSRTLIDFGTRARRHIVIFGLFFGFAGLTVGPTDTLEPYDLSGVPFVSCLTDSYGTSPSNNFIQGGPFWNAAQRLGFRRFAISPGGGSGYVTGGTGSKLFSDRLSNVVVGTPDMVMVAGGINDSTTGLQAAATSLFAGIRSALPSAVLAVFGPWTPNSGAQGSAATGKRDLIYAALQTVSGPWIMVDNVAGTWATSNGKTGTIGNTPWQTGNGRAISFTGALSAATSGTLTANWGGTTGSYTLVFSDGSTRTATLTSGSAAVSWTGAVTATASAGAYNSAGNAAFLISDGTHPNAIGGDYLGGLTADALVSGLLALQ